VRYGAIKFEDTKGITIAMHELDHSDEPVEYDVVLGSLVLVFPSRIKNTIWDIVKQKGLTATEIETRPFSSLSPKDQAKRRGYPGKRKSA
jgi:hypothetical protein